MADAQPSDDASAELAELSAITAKLDRGEARHGQHEMALAVGDALRNEKHLFVQAGTGTGKSLAYLVPAILSGKPTIVATATKALQDQLAGRDLPFLAEHLDRDFSFAVLKGRSNYVCQQRLHEIEQAGEQLGLDGISTASRAEEIERLAEWADDTHSGDRSELDFEPSHQAWSAVSVGPRECPGASRCSFSETCWAERARRTAAEADVVVVNTHLYGVNLAAGGVVLPEHEAVIIDEAHQLEDIVSSTSGAELTAGRLRSISRTIGALISDPTMIARLDASGDELADALAAHLGQRLRGAMPDDVAAALISARAQAERALEAARKVSDNASEDVAGRKLRTITAATSLIEDVDTITGADATQVIWVEGTSEQPVLRVAPIDLTELLEEMLWNKRTVVMTSATLPSSLGDRLGVDAHQRTELDVGSPFDYERQSLLYCATELPDPRTPNYDDELARELERLIVAAGGRTLALFTSWRAMRAAADALDARVPWKVMTQSDLPKPALIEAFKDDEESCLFATMGFWQGIDIPGRALSLVTIDKIPFPRPDDPLLQARRELARADAFRTVDLPRAATLLAQAAGRLIRTQEDAGVVAVLDPRLAKNARYRWDLINALPPMRRTKDRDEVVAVLNTIRDASNSDASNGEADDTDDADDNTAAVD